LGAVLHAPDSFVELPLLKTGDWPKGVGGVEHSEAFAKSAV
jgi:hypothetical protein